jgi:threonine dehydrogenase-like Zn-dependent dehydrogenase
MKVVAITGKQACEIVERPDPKIKANYVKIKIHAAPICTEFHQYQDGSVSDCLGHEAAGEVVETAGPVKVKVGDRVVVMPQNGCGKCSLCLAGESIHCTTPVDPMAICGTKTGRATYAQYCIQQDWLLVPIPDDISYDEASMACCGLGPTFNAMELMGVDKFDTVLISGLGPVGLGGALNALFRGARVICIEANPYRVDLAKAIGVEAVVNPADKDALAQILALTGGFGADKSIETSSAKDAPAFLVEATRRKGHLASVGWGGPMTASSLVYKGLTVHGAWHWNHFRHSERMMKTIRGTRHLLAKTITHRFPMSRVKDAWELQLTGRCGKIILHPWE